MKIGDHGVPGKNEQDKTRDALIIHQFAPLSGAVSWSENNEWKNLFAQDSLFDSLLWPISSLR